MDTYRSDEQVCTCTRECDKHVLGEFNRMLFKDDWSGEVPKAHSGLSLMTMFDYIKGLGISTLCKIDDTSCLRSRLMLKIHNKPAETVNRNHCSFPSRIAAIVGMSRLRLLNIDPTTLREAASQPSGDKAWSTPGQKPQIDYDPREPPTPEPASSPGDSLGQPAGPNPSSTQTTVPTSVFGPPTTFRPGPRARFLAARQQQLAIQTPQPPPPPSLRRQ